MDEIEDQEHKILVTYDIRDLLDRFGKEMAAGFATMGSKLDSKADKADVAALQKDIVQVSERVSNLENKDATRQEVEETYQVRVEKNAIVRQKRWNLFLTVGIAGGPFGAVLLQHVLK